jgi:hypothetical protein
MPLNTLQFPSVARTFPVLTQRNACVLCSVCYCTCRRIVFTCRLHKGVLHVCVCVCVCVCVSTIRSSTSCQRSAALSAGMSDGILCLCRPPTRALMTLRGPRCEQQMPDHRIGPPWRSNSHTTCFKMPLMLFRTPPPQEIRWVRSCIDCERSPVLTYRSRLSSSEI